MKGRGGEDGGGEDEKGGWGVRDNYNTLQTDVYYIVTFTSSHCVKEELSRCQSGVETILDKPFGRRGSC